MKAEVLSSSKNEMSVSIRESDIGTLYIVQHELLKAPSTKFAGVIVKHPLINECWMRVSTKGDPAREIAKAADAAIKEVAAVKEAFAKILS